MKTKIQLTRLCLGLILTFSAIGLELNAQVTAPPDTITRKDVTDAVLSVQRKYVNNMPGGFVVIDLENYPTGRVGDPYQMPGITYMTVAHFYAQFPADKLDIILNPQTYKVARDSSQIPPPAPRLMSPARDDDNYIRK